MEKEESVVTCGACEGEGAVMGQECQACGGTGEVDSSAPPAGDSLEASAPPANALVLPEDPVTQALAEVTKTNTTISEHLRHARELHRRYEGVAFDVRSTKGMEAARNARMLLRQERYPIQALQKAGSKLLGQMQRQFNARCEEITSEIEGYEAPIDQQITAEEQRKEAERTEKAAAEQRRIDGHMSAIRAIANMATEAAGFGSEEIEQRIAAVQSVVVDEGYEEFQGQALQARDEALRQLQGMLVAAKVEEAELEETRRQQAALAAAQLQLEAERRAQAEREAALAEREKALAEQEARHKAEQESLARAKAEREEAVQRRIDQFGIRAASYMPLSSSLDLRSAIATMHDYLITEELFDGRVAEAQQAKEAAIASLRQMMADAEVREAEQARQAQDARIQELIDNMRGMGDNAALAVEDGSADVNELQAGAYELRETACGSAELFGDRTEEAFEVRRIALEKIDAAILATEERDRLAAEEAERQRAQQELEAEARALVDAMRAHAEELYDMVRSLLALADEMAGGYGGDTLDAARALLLQINPNETFKD